MKEAKKTDRVGFRLKPRHRKIIDQSAALGFGSSKTAIIEALLDAFADALDREGTVTPPLYVTTKAATSTAESMLNESKPSTADERLNAAIKLLESVKAASPANPGSRR
jgi:uncharacterized protein (DUF1778 family)